MNKINIVNKKASFNYEFIETYVAGIVLHGTEIVAIRNGHIDISEAYCHFDGNELYLKNSSVSIDKADKFSRGMTDGATRDRKLLLNKSELKAIREQVKIKGLTVVPYKIFFNERHFCKVVIAVAKGKKNYDKRQTIKERDVKRQTKTEI